MRTEKILKDTSDWLSGHGILAVLTTNFDVPWKGTVEGSDLDLDYYSNHSGNKIISNLVEILQDDEGVVSDANLLKIATIAYNKYGASWDRAFSAFSQEYNPLHNYNGDEHIEDKRTTTYEGKEVTDENVEDKNKDNINHGVVSTTDKTFPTERKTTITELGEKEDTLSFTNRKDTQSEQGQTKDELDFGTGNNARKRISKFDGTKTSEHTPDDYTTTTESWGKNYNKQRINAFNKGFVDVSDNESLTGVGSGQGGAGGDPGDQAGHKNTTKTKESGSYTDTQTFDNYSETATESGKEIRTIQKTGLNGSGKYQVDKEYTGSETRTAKVQGIGGSGKYTKESVEAGSERDQNITTNYQKINTNTEKSFEDRVDTEEFEHDFHREGNYGVRTSQEMLEQEIELRKKYASLFDCLVYNDLDKVLTIGVFKSTNLS